MRSFYVAVMHIPDRRVQLICREHRASACLCFVTLFVLDERAATLGSRPKASRRSDTPLGTMAERGRGMETRGKTSFPKILNEYI